MTQNRSAQRMKLGIVLSTEEGGLQGRTPTSCGLYVVSLSYAAGENGRYPR